MSTHFKSAFVVLGLLFSVCLQTGCSKQQQVAGISNFSVDTSNQALKASVELTFLQEPASIELPVPHLDGSYLLFGPAPDGKGSLLELDAPFSSIIGAIDGVLPSEGLPDGRALVGTSVPTLPAFDVTIQSLSLRFYIAKDVFGFFLPLPLPAFSSPIQVPIKDTRGYVVAYGTAMPPGSKPGTGGLLVFFPIVANSGLISAK